MSQHLYFLDMKNKIVDSHCHLDFKDFEKALPFRKFADEINENPASLAHRYALSANKVGSVILGVKNRKELVECIEAEEKGLLD